MVSYTSRLRLSKPADGEAQDIDILNANFDAIDRAISAGGPYTSTTRPSAPYVGQMIYESDTKAVMVWNGAAWVYIPAYPRPKSTGVYGKLQRTDNTDNISNGNTDLIIKEIGISDGLTPNPEVKQWLGSGIEVKGAGKWQFSATILTNGPAAAGRYALIEVQQVGTDNAILSRQPVADTSSSAWGMMSISGIIRVPDVCQLRLYTYSNVAMTIRSTYFFMNYLGGI